MTVEKTIPVLRMFDYNKAVEFYIGWLGFSIAWEHTFEANMPMYMEIVKDGLTIHLSEHHGDGSPGQRLFLWCTGLKDYHRQLLEKQYKYGRPGLEETFYNAWCISLHDPFGNIILFNEKKPDAGGNAQTNTSINHSE